MIVRRTTSPSRACVFRNPHRSPLPLLLWSSPSLSSYSFLQSQRCHFITQLKGTDTPAVTAYDLLGLSAKAANLIHGSPTTAHTLTDSDIRRAFVSRAKRLQLRYSGGNGIPAGETPLTQKQAEQELGKLHDAYLILIDRSRRYNYDTQISARTDNKLGLVMEGGVFANFNKEHQNFQFADTSEKQFGDYRQVYEDGFSWSYNDTSFSSDAADLDTQRLLGSDMLVSSTSSSGGAASASGGSFPVDGGDVSFTTDLSFVEGMSGCSRTIGYTRMRRCAECNGYGINDGKGTNSNSSSSSSSKKRNKIRKCPQCHGRGTYEFPSGTYLIRKECSFCMGTGRTPGSNCPACKGKCVVKCDDTAIIRIPHGVVSNQLVRMSKLGDDGLRGGKPGALIVRCHVRDHDIFSKVGDNLHIVAPLPLSVALLGGILQVPVLQSDTATAATSAAAADSEEGRNSSKPQQGVVETVAAIEVPPLVSAGQKIVLSGLGCFKRIRGATVSSSPPFSMRGDLIVHLLPIVPHGESLTRAQRELLTQLDHQEGGEQV